MDSEGRQERLTDFFEAASIGLSVVGADDRVVEANRAELARLGYSREEYVGRTWSDFHVDPSHAKALLARLAAGSELRHEPLRLRRKDGEELGLVLDANARFDAGTFVAARCVTRDPGEPDAEQAERSLLAATDAVQRRVGRDLHDGLGQVLVGAALSAQRLADGAPDGLRGPLAKLVVILNDATTRVQNIVRGLAPIRVNERTLREALHDVCAVARNSGVECTLDVHASVSRRPESESAQICLIVQEALGNAIRHGRATQVRVELRPVGDRLVLSVRDNGSGVSADAKPGLGLESMRVRVKGLGGMLALENREGGGALVSCSWPA